jgi:ABC-type dipeptide/oligopeptide/nickel transport system permease subunit
MSVGISDLPIEEAEAEVGAVELVGGEIAARSPWELFLRRFREDKFAIAGITFLVVLILVAILAPLVTSLVGAPGPYSADQSALDLFGQPTGPSSAHLFGVDQLGRDVFSRVIYGARVSLLVAFISTAITTAFGVFCGLLAGYYRGWIDTLVSRTVDAWLAIPYLLLAIGLASACSFGTGCLSGLVKPGVPVVIAVIAITSWTYPARIIRGQVLSLREKEFVDAARSLGASNTRIIVKELLPNLAAPIIVFATTFLPTAILFEAALSFLGVGVQPPTSSWGQMISDASLNIQSQWWYMLFPGLALLFTVLAFNFVGDAMTDALNPRTRKS